MHLPEMSLPAAWAAGWFGASAPVVAVGMRKLNKRAERDAMAKPLVGLMGAAIFVISLFPIPLPGGTSSHAVGTPLAAIILGPWLGTLLSVVALFLQAVLFAHGGLTTLGANVFSMGVVGSFSAYLVFWLLRGIRIPLPVAAGIAALLGDLAVYVTTSVQLAAALGANQSFVSVLPKFLMIFLPTQLPLALAEGILTGGILGYLKQIRPELLVRLHLLPRLRGDVDEKR